MDAALIAVGAAIEGAVEPAEEALALHVSARRLQHGGAERRRQHQGDEDGQHHGRDDRHRELAVDDADRAGEEGHRHEHGRQHQGDADQRAGDLAHRLLRRLARRQPLFRHHALDVLDHHDGVVDEQADRQHHGEHGQRVDRIAREGEHGEGAEQHDRHGNRRDQRGAEALQEDEHDDEDEDDGLDQRLDHLLDRKLDERGGVIGRDDLDVGRQARRQLGEHFLDASGRVDGISAGGEVYAKAGSGQAVEARTAGVAFRTDLDARDIAQMDDRAVSARLQDDVAELVRRLQLALRRDRDVELLALNAGQRAELAGRDLLVLGRDRRCDVARDQLVLGELVRIEPDAHRISGSEDIDVADSADALDRVLETAGEIVAEIF